MRIAKLVVLLLATPLLSLAATDYLKEGELFTKTRAQLLRDKWKPIPMNLHNKYAYEALAQKLVNQKFTEVEACSVDTSNCDFFYKKDGKCLRLDTIGEQIKIMKVVQWSNECPRQ
jgi:hypothetical protein